MANSMKILTTSNMPDSSFKLSTVSRDTIEVHSSFKSQLSTITARYDSVSDSLKKIKNQMTTDATKYKSKLDVSKIKNLQTMADYVGKQATYCENRAKAIKNSANQDTADLAAKAKAAAWKKAIDEILKDSSLSDSARSAISNLKNYL